MTKVPVGAPKFCRHQTLRRVERAGHVIVFRCVDCDDFITTTVPRRPTSRPTRRAHASMS